MNKYRKKQNHPTGEHTIFSKDDDIVNGQTEIGIDMTIVDFEKLGGACGDDFIEVEFKVPTIDLIEFVVEECIKEPIARKLISLVKSFDGFDIDSVKDILKLLTKEVS